MLRPQFKYDYTAKGSFIVYFDFEPKNDYCKLSLEIHLFGRSIWLSLQQKEVE